MPQRAPHPCHWPNCSRTVRQGAYCDEHRQRRDRTYNADHADEKRFYRRATWRKFRLAFLWENPLCVVCFERGQLVPAEHVDHVIPRRLRPDLELDPENCQALCASCHSRKTVRERYHGGSGNPLRPRERTMTGVTTLTVAPLSLAAVQDRATQASLPATIKRDVGIVLKRLDELKLPFNRCVVVYWPEPSDSPCMGGEFPLSVGWEIDATLTSDETVLQSVTTPGGLAATAVHLGPYDRMGEAHERIHEYCKQHGLLLAGPNWEIYDHQRDDEPPSTDVFYLLEAASSG